MPRLLILSHGHPVLSQGGAERASYAIHALIKDNGLPGWDSVYVARVDSSCIGHDGDFGAFRGLSDEIIASPPPLDPFFQSSLNPGKLSKIVGDIVSHFRPDVVHIHHFSHWGTEIFDYFKKLGIPVIFTFHEFMAICHRFGQMVKTNGQRCMYSSPAECGRCFSDITAGQFFLRNKIFEQRLFGAKFLVSPSQFLADRVEAWCGSRKKIKVIENPQLFSDYENPSEHKVRANEVAVIGYFGQINQFKGTELLLNAAQQLKFRGLQFRIVLYGANLEVQESEFKSRIMAKLEELVGFVEFFGPYTNSSVLRLMARCDCVVVPSTWWENSPVVIQEALGAGVTVVGARHGGIEEKLKGYEKALMFEPSSSSDLARTIEQFIKERSERSVAQTDHYIINSVKKSDAAWKKLCSLYNSCI